MQQSIGLTKDNVMLITTDMGKPTEFHGIEMKFLKRSILYMFRGPVKIKRSNYSLLITDIDPKDQITLNTLFQRFDPKIIIKDSIFINYNDVKGTVFEDSKEYMIQVEIQGVKKNGKNINLINRKIVSPIWKIRDIL